jgi:hypothetical protein
MPAHGTQGQHQIRSAKRIREDSKMSAPIDLARWNAPIESPPLSGVKARITPIEGERFDAAWRTFAALVQSNTGK